MTNMDALEKYGKPTLAQSIASWLVLNKLLEIGYPHNFQGERSDIRDYMFDISKVIRLAFDVKEMNTKAERD